MAEEKVPSPYPVKYSRRYVYQKLVCPVLQKDTIEPSKREALNGTAKTLVSGPEVEQLVWEKKGHEQGWMYKRLDAQGRIGLLLNRGIEVALFYERLITYEEPQPGAPPPVAELKYPEDTWMRLDLLKNSARQQNLFIKQSQERLDAENKLLNERVVALSKQVEILETDLFKANKLLDLRKQAIGNLNQQLATAKGIKPTPVVKKKVKKSDFAKRFKAAQQKIAEEKARQKLQGAQKKNESKKGVGKNNRRKGHSKARS